MKKKKTDRTYRGTFAEDSIEQLPSDFFKTAKVGLDGLAELIGEDAVKPIRSRGRPKTAMPKMNATFRLGKDIVDALKSYGRGYNSRVESVLREAMVQGKF